MCFVCKHIFSLFLHILVMLNMVLNQHQSQIYKKKDKIERIRKIITTKVRREEVEIKKEIAASALI